MATTNLTIEDIGVKSPAETRKVSVSFEDCLDAGETLTGTPTVTGSADLTLSAKAVSSGALTIKGKTVAAGLAITFLVAGGSVNDNGSERTYTITIRCNTSADQVIERFVRFKVAIE